MLPSAIIAKKRDRFELSNEEIRFMIQGIVMESIPDYQLSAWAMAVLCRGMTQLETDNLTDAMLQSGGRLGRASDRPRVDKHSTGGLGDKVSLILAPLLACFDLDVPMLSGRGLGITGGTLDKLESYSGLRCNLSEHEIEAQLKQIGCVITGTTANIAPADRKLYALRDVTATVPSIALITSSIMSKKLAANLDALVLDIKFGSGAFMQDLEDARQLGRSLLATGERMNLTTRSILSNMNQPLGQMVGNACEANEAVKVLGGEGPADVRDLTLRLCSELLVAIGKFSSHGESTEALQTKLDSGFALERLEQMITRQHGRFVDPLPLAETYVVEATRAGWIHAVDGQLLGHAVIELGGGRRELGGQIDHQVGCKLLCKIGDPVEDRQPVAKIFARTSNEAALARTAISRAITISDEPTQPLQLYSDLPS